MLVSGTSCCLEFVEIRSWDADDGVLMSQSYSSAGPRRPRRDLRCPPLITHSTVEVGQMLSEDFQRISISEVGMFSFQFGLIF